MKPSEIVNKILARRGKPVLSADRASLLDDETQQDWRLGVTLMMNGFLAGAIGGFTQCDRIRKKVSSGGYDALALDWFIQHNCNHPDREEGCSDASWRERIRETMQAEAIEEHRESWLNSADGLEAKAIKGLERVFHLSEALAAKGFQDLGSSAVSRRVKLLNEQIRALLDEFYSELSTQINASVPLDMAE